MLCNRRLSILISAAVYGVGKATGDVHAVTFAKEIDLHFGEFLTDVRLELTRAQGNCPASWIVCIELFRRARHGH